MSNFSKLKSALLVLVFCCISLCNLDAFAKKQQSHVNHEQQAKVLEYIFTHISWPLLANNATLQLCILGDTPLDSFNLINGKTINNLTVHTESISSLENTHCQVLFVSKSEEKKIDSILKQVQNKAMLTMSDLPEFAIKGGAINLFIANDQPAFILNTEAIESQKLVISKEMFKILTIIPEVEAEPEQNDGKED
jgi:YfiR/HmsC-like